MKISQMTTDQAADVLVRLADPIARIMGDEEAQKMLEDTIKGGVENALVGWSAILTKLVPFCLKKHRTDLFEVIAALDGKTTDEVAKFSFLSTLRVLRDSVDKELWDFFKSIGGANIAEEDK